jgi:hypothetical protein
MERIFAGLERLFPSAFVTALQKVAIAHMAPTACPHKAWLPKLFAKILFQQMPQGL